MEQNKINIYNKFPIEIGDRVRLSKDGTICFIALRSEMKNKAYIRLKLNKYDSDLFAAFLKEKGKKSFCHYDEKDGKFSFGKSVYVAYWDKGRLFTVSNPFNTAYWAFTKITRLGFGMLIDLKARLFECPICGYPTINVTEEGNVGELGFCPVCGYDAFLPELSQKRRKEYLKAYKKWASKFAQ